jgi:hypothetical protein
MKRGRPYELKEKYRRSRRGSVIEDKTQYVVRAYRLRRDGMQIKCGGFQAGTTGNGRSKASGISIEALPMGFAGPTVYRLDLVNLRLDCGNL